MNVTPVSNGVELSWEPPRELPSGYIIELCTMEDKHHLWRELSRIPSADRGRPLSSFLLRHLEADKSYRFRVIPFRDEIYGRPVESLVPYRLPHVDELEFFQTQRPRTIPPPRGPVSIEELPSGLFRLGWRPPAVDSRSPISSPITYIIEQRVPGRRQWLEVGRTPNLSYTLDVDTTSQFRVKALVGEYSSLLQGGEYLIGSDDGPQSDWIRFDEKIDSDQMDVLRSSTKGSVIKVDETPIPKRLYASHVGPSSVLLEWEYPTLSDHSTGYLYLEQKLISDSKEDFVQPLWEPIARVPISKLNTSYEVTNLLPGRSYIFRLIDKYGGYGSSLIQREVSLPEPVKTRGGYLRSISLPKDMEQLMIPRNFSIAFRSLTSGGPRFSWLPPEGLESQTDKIRYRIEARSVFDNVNEWRLVTKDLKGNDYTLTLSELEKLVTQRRLPEYMPKGASSDWYFRIIASVDGVDSHPKLLSSPVSITSESGELHSI